MGASPSDGVKSADVISILDVLRRDNDLSTIFEIDSSSLLRLEQLFRWVGGDNGIGEFKVLSKRTRNKTILS